MHATSATRRSFLRAGFLGCAGLTLADLIRLRAAAPTKKTRAPTSVILFWLGGGPSHFETYDPKPDAPAEIRGVFNAIPTSLPGVHFSDLLPRQAQLMDRLAVIRSIAHTTSNHAVGQEWLLTGYEVASASNGSPPALYPAMGSVTARLRGMRSDGILPYVLLNEARLGYHGATYLGQGANPYQPLAGSQGERLAGNPAALTLAKGLTVERLDDRLQLLRSFDQSRALLDNSGVMDGIDQYREQAVGIMTSPALRTALDLDREPLRVREHYGANPLGRYALLARRLVESGVSFVTISHDVWDDHGELPRKIREHAPPFDRAFSALVEELADRGMLEHVLVAAFGEFGRTPVINKDAGRDHWPNVMSAALAGGGLKSGIVVGKSNPLGEEPIDTRLGPEDLLATIYHVLGIDHHQTFADRLGRPIAILPRGELIRQLV